MMAVTGRCLLGAGQRLAGEHGFVNAQAVDVEQAQVGGDLVARLQQHLAGHDLARSALEGCSHRQVRYEAHSNTGVDTVADMCALDDVQVFKCTTFDGRDEIVEALRSVRSQLRIEVLSDANISYANQSWPSVASMQAWIR
jgi:hypothetical protein